MAIRWLRQTKATWELQISLLVSGNGDLQGVRKIRLAVLESKYFKGLFNFLQKAFVIRSGKGLEIICIQKNSLTNHTWPQHKSKFLGC